MHPDSQEVCFEVGNRYYFILDRKKNEIFTIDETQNVHFFNIDDSVIDTNFYSVSSGVIDRYNLDDITRKRLEKLYKERRKYSEQLELDI